MNRRPILIVHPDREFADQMKLVLSEFKCDLEVCNNGVITPDRIMNSGYSVMLVHEEMVMKNGQTISDYFLNHSIRVPVILFSDKIDVGKAVEAVKKGAHDYFTKDSNVEAIKLSIRRVLERTTDDRPRRGALKFSHSNTIISRSQSMEKLLKISKRVSKSGATVLVEGESGTGKELIARFIHQESDRAGKPFVAMNCAALPENLAESELFGYDKGAFTGATKNRIGKFEQAQGGTLVLDEISEMPLSLQVKLLRVLQEREVDHIGGQKPIPVDVRVIATCNRELVQMVKEGTFRQDLYYRLRVIPLKIPPLRERPDDIPLLVDHFTEKYGDIHQSSVTRISTEAMAQLSGWSWPGNVRELENTIERAILICDGPEITPEHLFIEDQITVPERTTQNGLVGMTVKEIERKLIGQTLKHVNENRTHAAQMLGISIRTLRNKLREYAQSDEPEILAASGNNV